MVASYLEYFGTVSTTCGSIAYNIIMTSDGHFREHALPNKIYILNALFLVPAIRRELGGCTGNVVFALEVLGGESIIMDMAGQGASPYMDYLSELGISTAHVTEIPDTPITQAMITTNPSNNQITALRPGAMSYSSISSAKDALPVKLGLVGPDNHKGMLHHTAQFVEFDVPFIFDLG